MATQDNMPDRCVEELKRALAKVAVTMSLQLSHIVCSLCRMSNEVTSRLEAMGNNSRTIELQCCRQGCGFDTRIQYYRSWEEKFPHIFFLGLTQVSNPCREVEKLAALRHLLLRTGCFCNPGACAHHLGLSPAQLRANYEAGHVCWDDRDVVDGRPTGAVRVSYGYMSTYEDARAVIEFIRDYFVESKQSKAPASAGKKLMVRFCVSHSMSHFV
jgi:hypothetical protein